MMKINTHAWLILLCLFLVNWYRPQEAPKKDSLPAPKMFGDETSATDYLLIIEKVDGVLRNAHTDAEFGIDAYKVFGDMKATDERLKLILASIKRADLNVRNQQMYQNELVGIRKEIENQNNFINTQDAKFNKIGKQVVSLKDNATLIKLVKDTVVIKQFLPELMALNEQYKKTDSLLNANQGILNEKKRQMLEYKTSITDAMSTLEDRLQRSGIDLFKEEYPALWKVGKAGVSEKNVQQETADNFKIEKFVTVYYFRTIWVSLALLAIFMLLLSWYIKGNLQYIKKAGYFDNLSLLKFRYLNNGLFIPILLVGICIAVMINLYAPATFSEILQLGLIVCIFLLFRKSWEYREVRSWLFIMAVFILICLVSLFLNADLFGRCLLILLNIVSIGYTLLKFKNTDHLPYNKMAFKLGLTIFMIFSLFSVFLNLFGRVSLAQNLSLTGITVFVQIISLNILLKIITEIILLQIYKSRVKRGISKLFDHESLSSNLRKPFILILGYGGFAVMASNLNLWIPARALLIKILSHPNTIGSFTFTLGSVLLFMTLVWTAHLLQKYVAYFFGEIEDEDEENINKEQHSRLLITRLLILIAGYLLAVAASGMPLDKISIVIGALGVGVGLGLQSIVNNFVSGIILIFDRPIQIGDIIDVSSQTGRVKSMGLRTTKINAPNGAEIIIPNGTILSQNITNWTYTDNLKLVEITLTVLETESMDKINEIAESTLHEVSQVDQTKPYQIYYSTIAEGNYGILIKFWCSIYRIEETVSIVKQSLFSSFKENGISVKI